MSTSSTVRRRASPIAPMLGKDISRKSHAANMWRWPMCGRETGIMTMVVGLVIGGDQAELILLDVHANLIVVEQENFMIQTV